jgi:hypothetical protein
MSPWDRHGNSARSIPHWACPDCHKVLPGRSEIDIQIEHLEPDDSPLRFANGYALGIGRRTLLEDLSRGQRESPFFLGTVKNKSGSILDEWVTFHGREEIIVRGSRSATARICSNCRRQIYFAQGTSYLYPQPLPGVGLFDAHFGIIVATTAVAGRINPGEWPGLKIRPLKVFQHPKDGLGDLTREGEGRN